MRRRSGYLLLLFGPVVFLFFAGTYVYQNYIDTDVVYQRYVTLGEVGFTALICLVFILIGINFTKRRVD